MDHRISVHLAGRSLQYFRPGAFGQFEHIDCSHDGGFHRIDRVVLVMDGGSRAGEVVYFVGLCVEGFGHIMPDRFETAVIQQMTDVAFASGKVIVQTDHMVSFIEQPFAKVRSDKTGSSGYQYSFHNTLLYRIFY